MPQKVVDRLIVGNRNRCCTSKEPRKHVVIHHIDGSPGHNDLENHAVVCLDCHSLVSSETQLGRRYSINEVRNYKRLRKGQLSNASEHTEEEEDNCIDERYEGCMDYKIESHAQLIRSLK